MKLAILRHAYSIMNEQGLIDFQNNCRGLSELGIGQSIEIIPKIEAYNPDLIISSPETRAHQTVEPYIIKNPRQLILSPTLLERNAGEFEGLPETSVREYCEQHNINRVSFKPKNGESLFEAYERAKIFLEEAKSHKKERVLAVTHSAFSMCLEIAIRGKDIMDYYTFQRLANCELREFKI